MDDLTYVELSIRGLKQQIMFAFNTKYLPDIQKRIEVAAENCINDFNFNEEVSRAARLALAEQIQSIVNTAVTEVVNSEEFKDKIILGVKAVLEDSPDKIIEAAKAQYLRKLF